MEYNHEISIPVQLIEPLLQAACDTELSVEEVVEAALKNYMERTEDNG